MSFIVTSLDTAVADEMRTASLDPYGNDLHAETQTKPGNPCRHCLRRAKEGERLVLFSYSPFDARNPYKEVGPVFVHADGCPRYAKNDRLPEDFSNRPIVLRGYDAEQRIAEVSVVVDGSTERRVEELLADPGIEFVHARSFTHGCYLFRVDRTVSP
ncbi:MAG TPA: DUF1203 domain-containing protein [Candidatus Baltobacteraceae bacterium]|nr:DUF1203 domain-containing protein [Candidatus Baltobacteraceae bacterium]